MNDQQQYELVCKPALERIESHCSKIFNILEGNGTDGLVTKVALHDERIKTLQNWKRTAVGLGITLICGLSIALIMYFATKGDS